MPTARRQARHQVYLRRRLAVAAALVVVFRRWKRDADDVGDVTEEDRELVAAALRYDESEDAR